MDRLIQRLSLVSGIITLVLCVGFLLQWSFVTTLFPWQLSPLSAIFISSILAAIAVPALWIGIKGDIGATFGGAIDLTLMFSAIGVFSIQLFMADNTRQPILYFGIVSLISAVSLAIMARLSWEMPMQHDQPTPALVRYSFMFFSLALLIAGGALILKTPNIFPWNLSEELRVIYGWIFLGAMCYFLYAIYRPQWSTAQGPLMGFLAYDIILIVPFVQHFATVIPEQRMSLTIYTGVLIYSGLVAIYFLFFNPATRFGSLKK